MTLADRIRAYVVEQSIRPARERGLRTVWVRAAEVHAGLGLEHRFPAVCGALDAGKFLTLARVTLVERTGPPQSSTVEWLFRLE